MSSLNGTDQVTLLNETKADYTGITLYNNALYISDSSRRSVFYSVSGYSQFIKVILPKYRKRHFKVFWHWKTKSIIETDKPVTYSI